MDVQTFLQNYGWAGVLAWFAVEKVFPLGQTLVEKWLIPSQADERKARIDAEQEERDRKARLEERQIQVLENFDSTLQRVEVTLASMNTRLDSIERDQDGMRDTLTALSERFPRKNTRPVALPSASAK